MPGMTRPLGLAGSALLLLLSGLGCRTDYECADACRKVYQECDSSIDVDGTDIDQAQCQLICEEGKGRPQDGAALWLDCVQDSVCPGDAPDGEDQDLHRYDVNWCDPQFEILIVAA